MASRQITDIKTFTIGFDLSSASGLELGFDERPERRMSIFAALNIMRWF